MLNVNEEIGEEGLERNTYAGESRKSKIKTAVFLDNRGTEGINKVSEIIGDITSNSTSSTISI